MSMTKKLFVRCVNEDSRFPLTEGKIYEVLPFSVTSRQSFAALVHFANDEQKMYRIKDDSDKEQNYWRWRFEEVVEPPQISLEEMNYDELVEEWNKVFNEFLSCVSRKEFNTWNKKLDEIYECQDIILKKNEDGSI